jgi:hypothetical protein
LQQKNERKKKGDNTYVSSPFSFQTKEEVDGVFFVSSRRKEKKPREKKNAKKGGSLPFFSYFYVWDEALLLHSSLHVPSMLSSPPSSSLMSHVSSKLCATQAWELS